MKKHVLNIEKLYTGQTANALVLNQVDDDFPVLLPSVPTGVRNWNAWIQKFKKIHSDFNPGVVTGVDQLNEYVIDFNLDLQTKFKEKGHQELYMMDDTSRMKPNDKDITFNSDKTYLHGLNGRAVANEDTINSSQMNVLFPFKKVSTKSLYASQLNVGTAKDIDDMLEKARAITLQGKVSYEDCLQGVAQVGNNIYMMSPNIELGETGVPVHVHGNGLTIVNGYGVPYHFPHTMTLFQPSQDQYLNTSIKDFLEWYEKHDRKTRVSMKETYGGNVTTLKCLGPGSYDLELATYCPTDIVLHTQKDEKGNENAKWINLNSDTFRQMRKSRDGSYEGGKYVFDNALLDYKDDVGDWHFGEVGLMFNMYDTFITGSDRILKMHVPMDKDYNKLILKFEWQVLTELIGQVEAVVEVNENKVIGQDPTTNKYSKTSKVMQYEYDITDAATKEHDIEVVVRIFYDVDFGKRNTENEYREQLKRSGVLLKNIRIENGVTAPLERLTFGSYVNEVGLTDEEREDRYFQFWIVSQYKRDMAYQTVIESPLKNTTTAGIKFLNNYSSGDIYGDMFVTKSLLNSGYDMDIQMERWDDKDGGWFEKDAIGGTTMMRVKGRDYIGLDSCSNQLALFYKPMDIAIGHEQVDLDGNGEKEDDERVFARRVNPDPDLNYQMVEVVKNINRFESSIKHKSNVFSVVVENSNLAEDTSSNSDEELEKYKKQLRDSVTQFVRNTCEGIVPVHTQLFDVQFT